jgi:hypothetical protein
MSVFKYLQQELITEAEDELDIDAGGETQDTPIDDEPTGGTSSMDGDPKEIVDTLIRNAKGQMKAIESMLKYAANSNPDYDIFDASLDYFESVNDGVNSKLGEPEEKEKPLPDDGGDDLGSDELMLIMK